MHTKSLGHFLEQLRHCRETALMLLKKLVWTSAVLAMLSTLGSTVGLFTLQALQTEPKEDRAIVVAQAPAAKDTEPKPNEDEPKRVDHFGDPLPVGAIARLGTVRMRHGDRVLSVAISPDGKTLASGSELFDGVLRLWDTATGREIRRFGGAHSAFYAVAFSPDGLFVAGAFSSGNHGAIGIWEVVTGKHVAGCSGHAGAIMAIAFSPDGKMLVSGAYDKVIRLWDVSSGKELRRFEGHEGGIFGLTFSTDGKYVLSGSGDRTVRIWDAATGAERQVFRGHTGAVYAVTFVGDGKTIASASHDKTVRLWDVNSGKELFQCEGHKDHVRALAVTPDGRSVISGSRDRTIRWWDVATGKETRRLEKGDISYESLSLSRDGRLLAAGSSCQTGIVIWDLTSGKEAPELGGHKGWVLSLKYTPDGTTLISGGSDGVLRAWDARTGKERAPIARENGWFNTLAVSPDGRTVAGSWYDKTFRLWEIATGKCLQEFAAHQGDVVSLAFHPNNEIIASGSVDRAIWLWDVKGASLIRALQGHTGEIKKLAFLADGKHLVSGDRGRENDTVIVWNIETGNEVQKFQEKNRTWLCLTPDGQSLVFLNKDRIIQIVDPLTGRDSYRITVEPRKAEPGGLPTMYCLGTSELSRSGRFLMSGCDGNSVGIVEMATGKYVAHLKGHIGGVYAMGVAPDGKSFASASSDSSVLVWRTSAADAGDEASGALAPAELEILWNDLASADAAKAYRAIGRLAAAPLKALPFLQQQLRLPAVADANQLSGWIRDLDSDDFNVRQKATQQLERQGETAAPALRKKLENKPTLEARRRVEALLEKEAAHRLRIGRALEVLEQTANDEARTIVKALAEGEDGCFTTLEARATLQRMTKRSNR